MEINNDNLLALLEKYLSGNCSEEERLAVEDWYERFEKKAVREVNPAEPAFQSDQIYKDVTSRLKRENAWPEAYGARPHKRFLMQKIAAVAAVFLILLGSILGWQWLMHKPGQLHYQFVFAKAGEHKYIKLKDGTLIWLSPGSKLKYPDDFDESAREVSLNGEAFFEVAKDHVHPFIIQSGKLSTRVLGTSFDIQAYSGRDEILVTVVAGKVQVKSSVSDTGGDVINLLADQRAVYNTGSMVLRKEEFPNAGRLMMERKEGRLTYKGTLLTDVISDVERYYNINIKPSRTVAGCTFFGDIDMNDSLDKVFNQILLMLNNASLKKRGNEYFLDADPCGT